VTQMEKLLMAWSRRKYLIINGEKLVKMGSEGLGDCNELWRRDSEGAMVKLRSASASEIIFAGKQKIAKGDVVFLTAVFEAFGDITVTWIPMTNHSQCKLSNGIVFGKEPEAYERIMGDVAKQEGIELLSGQDLEKIVKQLEQRTVSTHESRCSIGLYKQEQRRRKDMYERIGGD